MENQEIASNQKSWKINFSISSIVALVIIIMFYLGIEFYEFEPRSEDFKKSDYFKINNKLLYEVLMNPNHLINFKIYFLCLIFLISKLIILKFKSKSVFGDTLILMAIWLLLGLSLADFTPRNEKMIFGFDITKGPPEVPREFVFHKTFILPLQSVLWISGIFSFIFFTFKNTNTNLSNPEIETFENNEPLKNEKQKSWITNIAIFFVICFLIGIDFFDFNPLPKDYFDVGRLPTEYKTPVFIYKKFVIPFQKSCFWIGLITLLFFIYSFLKTKNQQIYDPSKIKKRTYWMVNTAIFSFICLLAWMGLPGYRLYKYEILETVFDILETVFNYDLLEFYAILGVFLFVFFGYRFYLGKRKPVNGNSGKQA